MRIFSPSLKRQLKDCILAILWPKKEIYNFFKDHSLPVSCLKSIEDWDEKGLSRADMIDCAFNSLSQRPDNGTVQFNLLLESLSTWSHFDDYWFKIQKKLDISVAKQKIAQLKIAKTQNIDKAKERKKKLDQKNFELETRHASLKEMQEDFQKIALKSGTVQERGFAFEKFLTKMARFFDLTTTKAFKVHGTQIDGTIKYDGENYVIEAKWEHQQISDEPLLAFCRKQDINMHGRGLFISVNGFTEGALSMLVRSNVKNTVLIDGEDLAFVLNELITFPMMLERKIHAAQTKGSFYINPVSGETKIKV